MLYRNISAARAAEKMAEQNSSAATTKKGSRRTRRLGMPWIRRYTHYTRDSIVLELIKRCGHAAYTWLDFILLHLASLWEAEGEQGLEYPIEYWLEQVCLLKPENLKEFELFLETAHNLGLLVIKRNGDRVKIASPDLIALADEYTRKKQRRQEKQTDSKKETTRTRLARLEEQVAKLTETVAQLVNTIQSCASAPPAAPVREEKPSKEEKAQILQEFKEKFLLETDDWRKAVILLSFPPKESIGPGYLARMTDLSQAGQALARWRETKRTQKTPEKLQKLEEAKVYAKMIKDGFDPQIPPEIAPLVQQILKSGGNGHVRA